MEATQQEVYNKTAKPAVLSILEGYNSTIFAYGQTGTGKTYTMEGFTYDSNDAQRGIIPRSIEEIFNHIESFSSPDTKFMVRASYLQIYNESISDLLKPEKISLQIREDKKKGVFVEGLSEWAVRNPADIYTLLQKGASSRTTASTKMNDVSSRSHAVFTIVVEQLTIMDSGDNESVTTQIKVGKLNMVDLAGSERIRVTGATGKQLEESKNINWSLSCLGNVIYALTDSKGRTHIPYRDSKVNLIFNSCILYLNLNILVNKIT
jgi:GTPase SAR1 family protein